MIGKIIIGVWAFFTTAATLVLGLSAYRDGAALDKLDAREKLDGFMATTRNEYNLRCVYETQSLRPIWQSRFDALVDIAKVDTSKPPYNTPCRYYAAPNSPSIYSFTMRSSKSAAKYSDWKSFIAMHEKKATLWVGDVPIEINVNSADWLPLKERYEEMLGAIKKCENKEQSKTENTFISVNCFYDLNEDNNVELHSYENKSKTK